MTYFHQLLGSTHRTGRCLTGTRGSSARPDLSMPIMNGLQETRLLKKPFPPPIILYTAHTDNVHEGAPFVGHDGNDHNLLPKGRPLIMRFRQLRMTAERPISNACK
jgi:hypothetical protein